MENLHGKTEFPEEGRGEIPDSRFQWVHNFPSVFLILLENKRITPSEFAILSVLWKAWKDQNDERRRPRKSFSISLTDLSKRAHVGRTAAFHGVNLALRLGLLLPFSSGRGVVGSYIWNVENFAVLQKDPFTTRTTPVRAANHPECSTRTTPVRAANLVYISRFLDILLKSYKGVFAKLPAVENSEPGAENVGPVGPFTSWEQFEAAAEAAILALWHGSGNGGSFPLHQIQLVFKPRFVNPTKVRNVTAVLFALLSDEADLYQARKLSKEKVYSTEEEFLNFLAQNSMEVSQ